MIDTIELNFTVTLPSIRPCKEWIQHIDRIDDHVSDSYEYKGPKFRTMAMPTRITAKYFPKSRYTHMPLLKITVGSVQKLIFGNNYQNSTDITLIIDKVNEQLRKIPGLESIDAGEGLLRRVDFCKNHQVGRNVTDYIELINCLDYDHRSKSCYANKNKKPFSIDFLDKGERFNGVVFSSNNISTSFYNKEKECNNPRARGILRHEVRIKGKKKIAECTGLSDPKLKDLTPHIAKTILKKDLARLGLNREILSEESVHEQLVKAHGARKGSKLLGYLRIFNDHPGKTNKQIAEAQGVSYDTILTWSSELKKAGVLQSLAPRSIKFPPLTESLDVDDGKKPIKVLGDTRTNDELSTVISSLPENRQPGDVLIQLESRLYQPTPIPNDVPYEEEDYGDIFQEEQLIPESE